jgi:pre-mRNA-splicing helicase BRR2
VLDIKRFELIKVLLKNRWQIVYSILWKRAQDDAEKATIEAEMRGRPELTPILLALQGKAPAERDAKAKSIEKSIRREARQLASAKRTAEEAASRSTNGPDISKGRSILDLESLSFQAGSHLMSNKKVTLPPGSFRTTKKGYEEVHVPAMKAAPLGAEERLVRIEELPEWARPAFKDMKALNRVQSRLFQAAMFGSDNILVCAPTGSGKTNVAMLTMLHEIGLQRDAEGNLALDNFKIVYIAPMKSLVQEMVQNFGNRLQPYGISVKELTGDQNLTKQQINETQVCPSLPLPLCLFLPLSSDIVSS